MPLQDHTRKTKGKPLLLGKPQKQSKSKSWTTDKGQMSQEHMIAYSMILSAPKNSILQ